MQLKSGCLRTGLIAVCFLTSLAAQDLRLSKTSLRAEWRQHLPLEFEENLGQADSHVHYLTRGRDMAVMITDQGLTISSRGQTVSMRLFDQQGDTHFIAEGPTEGVSNYYFGQRRVLGARHFARVRVTQIRPGVDAVFYSRAGMLEYDLVLHGGADLRGLSLAFGGSSQPEITADGDIILSTATGELLQRRPHVWQERNGRRTDIQARYRLLDSGEVAIVVATPSWWRNTTEALIW